MTDKPLDCAGTTGPVGKHDFVDDRCRVCGAAFVVMGDRFLTGICSPECRDLSGEMRTAQELIEEELRNDPEFAEIHRRQMEIDAAPRRDIVRPGADSCAPVAPVVDVDWDEMQRFIEAGADEPDWDASWVIDRVRTCINANCLSRPTPRIDDQVDVEAFKKLIVAADFLHEAISECRVADDQYSDAFEAWLKYKLVRDQITAHYNLTRKGE